MNKYVLCICFIDNHFIFTDHGADNEKAREDMMYSFRSGTSACLVCIDNIKKEEPVSIYFMYIDQILLEVLSPCLFVHLEFKWILDKTFSF
jgi:hypothetical protein